MIKIAVIKSHFQALYDYIGHRFPVETFLTNASVGLLNSFSWPTDPLNLAISSVAKGVLGVNPSLALRIFYINCKKNNHLMYNHLNMLPKQAKFDLKCSKMCWRGEKAEDSPPRVTLTPETFLTPP